MGHPEIRLRYHTSRQLVSRNYKNVFDKADRQKQNERLVVDIGISFFQIPFARCFNPTRRISSVYG